MSRAGEDGAFRARLLAKPRETIERELGAALPEGHEIHVHEEGSAATHLVLPPCDERTEAEREEARAGAASLEFLRKTLHDPAPPLRPPAPKGARARKKAATAEALVKAGRESIRRCPAIVEEGNDGPVLQHTYTRAVARPHGWIFVIPLTVHTSYGYIFNRDVTGLADVEADFDAFLESDGVTEFEQRAVIPFPNFVHRRIFDGAVARIGNAAAFMEPLEATAIVSAQLQIGMVLHIRLNRSIENLERAAPVVNRFLIGNMLCYGLFVGWHYSCGSRYDSDFWRYAREQAWPRHREAAAPEAVGCTALQKFDEMIDLLNRAVIDKADWTRMCAVPLTSYAQMSQGLGC